MLKVKTLLFKALISIDRMFNLFTGGGFQETFSTRCYINAQMKPPGKVKSVWVKIEKLIDWMFWEYHCKYSFEFEMRLKREWAIKYGVLNEN